MFEKLLPPIYYTTHRGRCQGKFDFVKNLTMAGQTWIHPVDPARARSTITLLSPPT